MGKRVKALLVALALLVTTVLPAGATLTNPVTAQADDNSLSIVFHFTGTDLTATGADGVGYQLYTWSEGGGEGAAYDMVLSDDGTEMTYKHVLPSTATLRQGFIVRLGNDWSKKDWEADRFVDLSSITGGTVNVYIESKVGEFTQDNSDAIEGLKITSAKAQESNLSVIRFGVGVAMDDISSINLRVRSTEDGSFQEITSINPIGSTNKNFNIQLAEDLVRDGSYELVYDYGSQKDLTFLIGMPDPYSYDGFEDAYTYEGDDLGATWSENSTTFRVWAPLATKVQVNLYESGTQGTDDLIDVVDMTSDVQGTWVATVDGDLNGTYYTYTATVKGVVQEDIVDPYARTTGVNGNRGMVINLDSTDPEGWEDDTNPNPNENYTDDVLYELHVKDFSYEESSGVSEANRGKYLAFTEEGTTNSYGQSTCLDYLKDLGITHVHILPMYDYASVKEDGSSDAFNWGYDPQNFNTPEGSYSTDPYNGEVRVKEVKEMVKSLHDSGISVVLDVVYGHVNSASQFPINRLTPNYYSRPNSNASGCGNDTATERSMNRKFIVDSFVYWATEYHVNGFRIDQEGLFDVDTINEVITALHEIDPSIIVYGEGWDMSSTKVTKAGTKLANQSSAPDIADGAFFSDGIRDAVKGSVFGTQAGYVTGNTSSTSAVINALYSLPGWENYDKPQQSVVNYNSCHDNYTLYDRLQITDGNTTADDETLLKQNSLAASIVMLAQGIPFFQAGEEILRTKVKSDGSFDENSYASPASENSIKWDTLNEDNYKTSYEYYKGLIAFRKLHPSFRGVGEDFQYPETGAIIENDGTVITYELPLGMNGDSSRIFVVYNPTDETYTAELPDSGTWNVYAKDDKAGTEVLGTVEDTMDVSPLTCMIVAQDPEIIVETTDYELNVGETVAINAKASPESALDDGISYEFDNKVVDVDPDGNITAVGSGDATIIIRLASNPNITKEVNVHVKDAAETVADTDKTVYTLGSAMSAVGWEPQNMANAFTDSDVNGVVMAKINVPAEGAKEWEYRFGIIATTDNTTQAWNRALVGTTVAPETTDTTSCCLTNIRPALEAEAYEAVVYYDTTTGAVAIYKADDTERTTPLNYTLSWVGNDNDETYYAPDEYTQFATVGDYEATLNAKADRTADLEKCGYTADSKLPDFVTLKEDLETKLGGIADLSVSYKVQVQKTGWEKSYVSDGITSGTVGQALRLEAIKIKLTNSDGTDFDTTNGGIEYRVHVQKNGWEKEYLANDELSGTVGEAKRLEAIQIRLTGKVADYYDVYYRVQAEKFGWLGWAKNDEEAGTSGYGYRLEGIQVVLVEKDGEAPTEAGGVAASSRNEYYSKTALPVVQYRVQVQTYGWQSYVKNGQTSGTVGKAKRLEAIRIKIADNKGVSGSIQYRTHVQKKGWQKWVSDDALSGTVGKALRLEAIQIKLTGDLAEKYDIYYRVQAEKFGWMGWAKNGASAGTSGYGYRLEAIQIQLAYKNSPSAVIGSTSNAYRSK